MTTLDSWSAQKNPFESLPALAAAAPETLPCWATILIFSSFRRLLLKWTAQLLWLKTVPADPLFVKSHSRVYRTKNSTWSVDQHRLALRKIRKIIRAQKKSTCNSQFSCAQP
jgi:hypothetical protein